MRLRAGLIALGARFEAVGVGGGRPLTGTGRDSDRRGRHDPAARVVAHMRVPVRLGPDGPRDGLGRRERAGRIEGALWRNHKPTSSRKSVSRLTTTVLLCLGVLGPLAVPSSAAASIVFIKGGNVWLAAADGTAQRAITTGGGWDAPSQADDGTILAQRGTQLFRFDRNGKLLAAAIDTSFTGAPSSWAGPVAPVISPDGTHQAYGGEITDSGVYDYNCGCIVYTNEVGTWWGSATQYSQPNQTLGQQDYDEPAWIDNGHLLLSSTGMLIDQVATYTLGGGDNSEVQWFSDPDPSVQPLAAGAITRAGDKLAFVANVGGGVGNEIRVYSTTGPPPFASGDPSNVPVDECNIGPNSFQSLRVSFSPDGESLAYDAPDGVHLVMLAGWPGCAGLSDRLIVPGGVEPHFGPADVPQISPPPPPKCDVPRLRGLGVVAARGRLVRAGCRLGRVRIVRFVRGRRGGLVVVGQEPSAGATRGANAKVSVVLGLRARRRHHR